MPGAVHQVILLDEYLLQLLADSKAVERGQPDVRLVFLRFSQDILVEYKPQIDMDEFKLFKLEMFMMLLELFDHTMGERYKQLY